MAEHVVARVAEIPPGSRKVVEVAGRSIGVFNVDGTFFALRNRCPHQGGPLCRGFLMSAVSADAPGEYVHHADGAIVRCPWHGWEFDVRTGRSWFDPQRTRVATYDVRVREQAEVETYPVSVRDEVVVVEIGRT